MRDIATDEERRPAAKGQGLGVQEFRSSGTSMCGVSKVSTKLIPLDK